MTWRLAKALEQLRSEVNTRWPKRDKASDGTIGDAAHAARTSDHNPWVISKGVGVVRALDIDKDGINASWYAEHIRQLGVSGDKRLVPNGYVIFNRRITSPDFKRWNPYNGSNPHTAHVHVSFSTTGYDRTGSWGISKAPATGGGSGGGTSAPITGVLRRGSEGAGVKALQTRLNRDYPLYSKLVVDGIFGPATEKVVREFQRRAGLAVDGLVGNATKSKLGLK